MTTTTTNLIERLRGLARGPSIFWEAANLLEAQALDLDIQAGSIEAVQAANSRLSAKIEAQAKQIEALLDNLDWLQRNLFGHSWNGVVVESLASIPDADSDQLWLVVKRTINGVTKRYVEKFNPGMNEDDKEWLPINSASDEIALDAAIDAARKGNV